MPPADAPRDMSCQELVELVTAYVDGALSGAERARFEAHVGECEGCDAHVGRLAVTVRMLGGLREDDVDAHTLASLQRAFRGWTRSR